MAIFGELQTNAVQPKYAIRKRETVHLFEFSMASCNITSKSEPFKVSISFRNNSIQIYQSSSNFLVF